MFALLNKSKNYLLAEIKYNFLKNVNHENNVFMFSPLNDIVFNKDKDEDEFLYPNKYNVYFKMYNIFSMFARDLSFYVNNHKANVLSSLLFDVYKFSLRDFLKSLLGSNNHLFYQIGSGTHFDTDMNANIYWSGNLGDTMVIINKNPVLYLNISSDNKNFHLDFGDIVKNIDANFNTFNISIKEMFDKSNKGKCNILTNIVYIKDILLKYLHEEKFKGLDIYFYLSDEDYNSYIVESSCYVKPILVFFYNKYRKDFLFIYENVYKVNNYYYQGRIRFYGNDLMYFRFYMIRVGKEIEMGIIFEFYPDYTYDKISFNIVNINGTSEEYTYNNNKEVELYEKVFKDRFIASEERFKKLYIKYLELIDSVFDRASNESKFVILNNNDLGRII